MKMLQLYVPEKAPEWGRIIRGIESIIPPERIRVLSTLSDLIGTLRSYGDCSNLFVFLFGSESDLDGLAAVKEYVLSQQIVVVLRDTDRRLVSKVHSFRPRVLLLSPVHPDEVSAVVAKMMSLSPRKLELTGPMGEAGTVLQR